MARVFRSSARQWTCQRSPTRAGERWEAAKHVTHSHQLEPRLEPGLQQWLPFWRQWRPQLRELREAVAEAVQLRVEEAEPETRSWFQGLAPHVKKAYTAADGQISLQLPVLRVWLARCRRDFRCLVALSQESAGARQYCPCRSRHMLPCS